jgi:hypothetical protein
VLLNTPKSSVYSWKTECGHTVYCSYGNVCQEMEEKEIEFLSPDNDTYHGNFLNA